MKNIYLSGFMGSGKSTIGRLLARKLNRPFLDTDAELEKRFGKPITQIFKKPGETAFRAEEARLIAELSRKSGLVVSLGGGAILRPDSRDNLKTGDWVFLNTPLAVIKHRLRYDKKRPLIAKGWGAAEALHRSRMPLYLLAPHVIYCGNHAADAVVSMILAKIS